MVMNWQVYVYVCSGMSWSSNAAQVCVINHRLSIKLQFSTICWWAICVTPASEFFLYHICMEYQMGESNPTSRCALAVGPHVHTHHALGPEASEWDYCLKAMHQ
eukprot:scpid99166/ scgid35150/ 